MTGLFVHSSSLEDYKSLVFSTQEKRVKTNSVVLEMWFQLLLKPKVKYLLFSFFAWDSSYWRSRVCQNIETHTWRILDTPGSAHLTTATQRMRSAVEREVRIGAWRAFLGIKGLCEDLQGSVGEPGPLKQDDLSQAPPRSDGGSCLCGSADQRETGYFKR